MLVVRNKKIMTVSKQNALRDMSVTIKFHTCLLKSNVGKFLNLRIQIFSNITSHFFLNVTIETIKLSYLIFILFNRHILLSLPVLFFILTFIHLFLAVLGLCCCAAFSLAAVGRGFSLVVVRRFLLVLTSLIEEHRLQVEQASVAAVPGLQSTGSIGSVVLWHMGSSQIRDQVCLLHWQVDSLLLSHQGSPLSML